MAGINPRVHPDHIGAIGRQGIVKLGALLKIVDGFHVLEEQSACVFHRSRQGIQIDLLRGILPVIRPDPDQVPFVTHDVDQFVLLKESSNRGISFSGFFSSFDGHRQMLVPKPEAQKNMRDLRTHPIHRDEVHGIQFGQVVGPVVILNRKIRLRPIVKVADVVDGDEIAIKRGMRKHRDFLLPFTSIGWFDGAPPREKRQKYSSVDGHESPAIAAENRFPPERSD